MYNFFIIIQFIEHLDFLSAMETDLELNPFKQLEHEYIGYQSLTDVPRALSYSEDIQDYSVSQAQLFL